jgi:putative ABC transport system permease protein
VAFRLARRDLRAHARRHFLSALGTALAIAVVVSAVSSRASYEGSITRAEHAVMGEADILADPVGAVDGRLSPEAVAALGTLPHVRRITPVLEVDARVVAGGDTAGSAGVRLGSGHGGGDGELAVIEGRAPTGVGEVALPELFVSGARVGVGDRVRLRARQDAEVVVTGLVEQAAGGAPRAVADLALVRRLDGDRPGWRSVLIELDGGVDAAGWLRENAPRTPAEVALQRSADVVADLRAIGASVGAGLDLLAWSTVLLGCLLCFHLTRISAAASRRQAALLRAVGASRRDLLTVDGLTAAATGVPGIVGGCLLGTWAAAVITPIVTRALGLEPQATTTPAGAYVLAALTAGAVAVSAVVASRSWAVPPVASLAGQDTPPLRRAVVAGGLALVAVGTAQSLLGATRGPLGIACGLGLVVGCVVTIRNALVWWGHQRPRRRVRPGGAVRALGVRAVARDAGVAGTSVGLIMATMAVLLATAVGHAGLLRAVDDFTGRQYRADLELFGTAPLPADATERLRAIPGVSAVTLIGFGLAAATGPGGTPRVVPVTAVDPASYFGVADFSWRTGDPAAARRDLGRGALALSQPLADALGVTVGGTLTMQSPAGPVPMRVVGTFVTFGGTTVVVGQGPDADRLGLTDRQGGLAVVAPGRLPAVMEAVTASFPNLRPQQTRFIRESARQQILALFGIGYGALFTAAMLCTVGMGASMSAAVLSRQRELRLLRAAGARRGQVVRMLGLEATVLVALGFAAAVPLGWLLSRPLLVAIGESGGLALEPELPIGLLVTAPPLILFLAATATVLPAWRAARVSLV